MKVLTSRVVVFAIVSILTSFVAHAEGKAVADGDKTGGVTEGSKSDLVSVEDRKIVASKSYVDDEISALAAHKVNGAPLSNAASYFYGEGVGAESAETKTVSIPSITGTPAVGQVIIVKPATTNTASTIKINLNNTTAYSVLYRGGTTNIPSEAWTAYVPSIFVLDETSGGTKYWRYVGTSPVAMTWGASETAAVNAYSTTFGGTTGNWPVADENKYVKGDSLASALSLKQNKLPAQDNNLVLGQMNINGVPSSVIAPTDAPGVVQQVALWDADGGDPASWDLETAYGVATERTAIRQSIPTVGAVEAALNSMPPLYWDSNTFPAAIDTYSTTFDPTVTHVNGNWPYLKQKNLVRADTFANSLARKQNKVTTGLVSFVGAEGTYQLPAIVRTNVAGNALTGNQLGIYDYATSVADDLVGSVYAYLNPSNGYTESDLDSFVPTLRIVAEESESLWLNKQNKLPAKWVNTSSQVQLASAGGQTIELGSNAGSVAVRYITEGGLQPLTLRSGADNVILYINGTKTLAQFQTSNFGITSANNEKYIKGALVNLETLKDVYSELQASIEDSDVSSHLVNGQPLSNNQITLYGTSDSTGTTKLVTLYDYSNPDSPTPIEMDALVLGTVIVIKPTVDQPAEGAISVIKITNVPNNGGRKMAKYHGRNIIPAMAQKIWKADSPSVWVYDGTNFNYVSGGLDSGLLTLDWDGDRHPGIINAYNTDFDSGTGHWWANEQERVVPSTTFAQGLALKQNILPAQASGAPVTIPTYPAYGTSDGVIGKMYLDTSSLYTVDDEHFPSSKLINTTLSSYVPKSDALNTSDTNSNLAAVSGAPSWATTNGVGNLYLVPGAASGTNWAATTLATWSDGKIVPTMDTLANSLAGLYDAVGNSINSQILNYTDTSSDIRNGSVPIPSQIEYTGDRTLDDGNQLFWLPQLIENGNSEARDILIRYATNRMVPTMDELAYALDGVLQTHETTNEWQAVLNYYNLRETPLFELADLINGSDNNATLLNRSGYLQTFAPTLEALMNESYELYRLIGAKQNKLSGTNGNLVTYGVMPGATGSKAIATTITNDANTVPNTAAVYNAVNERQIKIPQTGQVRDASGTMSAISDWTSASVKGTALVTKTSSDGVVGERKIFEAGATYTNDATTNIQIATIGAVMENTFTKTCAEYRPGTTGETAANCWLWQITSNANSRGLDSDLCSNPRSCSLDTDCCAGYSCGRSRTCERVVEAEQ